MDQKQPELGFSSRLSAWRLLVGLFLLLLVGALGFGEIVGLPALHTAIVFVCVLGIVAVLLLPAAMHERRVLARLAACACPKCGTRYARLKQRCELWSFGRHRGAVMRCAACGSKTMWTDAGTLFKFGIELPRSSNERVSTTPPAS